MRKGAGPDGKDIVSQTAGKLYLAKTPEIYAYDDDGNLTQDGRWTYTWDAENRLIAMESIESVPAAAKAKLTFAYSAEGRRIQKKVYHWNAQTGLCDDLASDTRFVYDGWNLIAEMDAATNSVTRSYLWGQDLSSSLQGAGGVGGLLAVTTTGTNGGSYLVSYDANGNVLGMVDNQGCSVAIYEYGPFSEPLRVSGPMAASNPFRFSTKYTDDDGGLIFYEHRPYQASTGRFLTRDPLGDEAFFDQYAEPLNDKDYEAADKESRKPEYLFVGNNPINSYDKLGLVRIIDEENSFSPSDWSDRTINVSWTVTHNGQTVLQGSTQTTPRQAYAHSASVGYTTGRGRPGDMLTYNFVCGQSGGRNGWSVTATMIDPWGIQPQHLTRRRQLQQQGSIPPNVTVSAGGGVSTLLYNTLAPARTNGRLYAE